MDNKPAIETATKNAMLTAGCRVRKSITYKGEGTCLTHDDYVTAGMCQSVTDIVAAGFTALMGAESVNLALATGDPAYGAPLDAWLAGKQVR